MYTFVKAIGLTRSTGAQWRQVDISSILVYDIFTSYTRVFLVLQNSFLSLEQNVDMDSLRLEYSSYPGTLQELLVQIGNRTLPTVTTLPDTQVGYVRYSDAVRSEYKIELTIAGQVLPEHYPKSELLDLKLTRQKYRTDMALVHDHCMVSVNGYYHRTDHADGAAYVYDGAVSMRKSKLNHVGILSFLDIGKLEKVSLAAPRIAPAVPGTKLSEKLVFSVDHDLEGKSFFLVLGGYLVMPGEGVFWQSSDHSFTLDLNRLPYVERLFESSKYLDLSSLDITPLPINAQAYNVPELFSDEVIKKYMTMSQSFLVIVDVARLVTNKIHVRKSNLPGVFTTYQDPSYPLIVNYGKAAEYWKVQEDGHWSMTVEDSFLRNYVLSEQPVQSKTTVTSQLRPDQPFTHSRGFLLEIAGYRHV